MAFVNESGSSLGVLMRADIEKAISIEDIDRFMEKSPDSVSRSSNIKSAIGRLSSSETPIPVVDSERNLLGVITQTSMLNALSE